MSKKLTDLGIAFKGERLKRDTLLSSPMEQFAQWFDEALAVPVQNVNAMTLATADADGKPSVRIVLLKSFDEMGFVFYTNYQSRKAEQLASNPHAAFVFFWVECERQICIEGKVSKVSAEVSDAYFAQRDRNSQLGAWASEQSKPIASRHFFLERFRELEQQYPTQIPRPESWGGYHLAPERIEFWQGGEHRLHDRFVYTKQADEWEIARLAP